VGRGGCWCGRAARSQYSRRVRIQQRPFPLVAAAALVGLEALVVLGAGLYLVVAGLAGDPTSTVNAELAGALAAVAGAGLLLVARGLGRAARWSRAPAVLTQIFSLPVGWSLVQSDRPVLGVPVLLVALAALVLLFHPATGKLLAD
jgi:hypothetical protein